MVKYISKILLILCSIIILQFNLCYANEKNWENKDFEKSFSKFNNKQVNVKAISNFKSEQERPIKFTIEDGIMKFGSTLIKYTIEDNQLKLNLELKYEIDNANEIDETEFLNMFSKYIYERQKAIFLSDIICLPIADMLGMDLNLVYAYFYKVEKDYQSSIDNNNNSENVNPNDYTIVCDVYEKHVKNVENEKGYYYNVDFDIDLDKLSKITENDIYKDEKCVIEIKDYTGEVIYSLTSNKDNNSEEKDKEDSKEEEKAENNENLLNNEQNKDNKNDNIINNNKNKNDKADNNKVNTTKENTNLKNTNITNNTNVVDNSTAKTILPQTGKSKYVLGIIFIICTGGYFYYKYKKIEIE